MAQPLFVRAERDAPTRALRGRRHHSAGRRRSAVRQIDRRALEQAGWRTTLEFRENHVRLESGQLIDVEASWLAEAERDGRVLSVTARSESRAWSRLQRAADAASRDFFAVDADVATS